MCQKWAFARKFVWLLKKLVLPNRQKIGQIHLDATRRSIRRRGKSTAAPVGAMANPPALHLAPYRIHRRSIRCRGKSTCVPFGALANPAALYLAPW